MEPRLRKRCCAQDYFQWSIPSQVYKYTKAVPSRVSALRTRRVLFLTPYHDILMRTRILASTDSLPSYLALCRRYEACSVLSHTIKNQILGESLLTFKDAQDNFEWFIENQYPIWDVITEEKEWTKEKVRIIRGIIRTAKDSFKTLASPCCKSSFFSANEQRITAFHDRNAVILCFAFS